MKTALIHISDFHIKEQDHFIKNKIDKMISALNVLGQIDKYIIIFSGDLANSGKINEYKKSKFITGNLLYGIKKISNNEKVEFFMVPGNHDMILKKNSRKCEDILSYYEDKKIDEMMENEIHLFDNFYKESNVRMSNKKDKIVDSHFINSGKIKIQVNAIC